MNTEPRASRTALALVVALAAAGAVVGWLVDGDGPGAALAVLGAAIVLGELLELRPEHRAPLPLSYAIVVVLLRAATPLEVLLVVLAAEVVAIPLRPGVRTTLERVWLTSTRLAATLGALGAYEATLRLTTGWDPRWQVLVALGAAAVGAVVVDGIPDQLAGTRRPVPLGSRAADLALVTSGVLMGIAYAGVGSREGMGLWAPLLFSVPLLAAWYSFERLASIRRTYEQTIGALSVVPELAGLVRRGHAQRVAVLAERLGHDLGLHGRELEYLRAATLLHHLGHLCLDDPSVRGAPIEPWEVADKGAEILRQTEYLAPAGDLLASDASALGAQILKVASAYDELTAGDPALGPAALEALYSGPGYVYDIRVLGALDRVVGTAVVTA